MLLSDPDQPRTHASVRADLDDNVEIPLLSHSGQCKGCTIVLSYQLSFKALAHVIHIARPLVNDHEETIFAVSLFEEWCDVTLSSTSVHFLLIEPVGDDECATKLGARFKEMGYGLPCTSAGSVSPSHTVQRVGSCHRLHRGPRPIPHRYMPRTEGGPIDPACC